MTICSLTCTHKILYFHSHQCVASDCLSISTVDCMQVTKSVTESFWHWQQSTHSVPPD